MLLGCGPRTPDFPPLSHLRGRDCREFSPIKVFKGTFSTLVRSNGFRTCSKNNIYKNFDGRGASGGANARRWSQNTGREISITGHRATLLAREPRDVSLPERSGVPNLLRPLFARGVSQVSIRATMDRSIKRLGFRVPPRWRIHPEGDVFWITPFIQFSPRQH